MEYWLVAGGVGPFIGFSSNPATQEAMIGELLQIAGQCDGVRCDLAMLVSNTTPWWLTPRLRSQPRSQRTRYPFPY